MNKLLAVLNPVTGELLDLQSTATESLAQALYALDEYRQGMMDFQQAVEDVLIERMDRQALWTLRVNDPRTGHQYEIRTASPTAGTHEYIPDALEHELRELIEEGTLNSAGASGALKRTLSVEFAVPWDADPSTLATTLKEAKGIQIAGVEVRVVKAMGYRIPVAAGIAKLRKIPGTGEALDRAVQHVQPPRRRAKVTLKGKAS
jgi:hypothetical protein